MHEVITDHNSSLLSNNTQQLSFIQNASITKLTGNLNNVELCNVSVCQFRVILVPLQIDKMAMPKDENGDLIYEGAVQ